MHHFIGWFSIICPICLAIINHVGFAIELRLTLFTRTQSAQFVRKCEKLVLIECFSSSNWKKGRSWNDYHCIHLWKNWRFRGAIFFTKLAMLFAFGIWFHRANIIQPSSLLIHIDKTSTTLENKSVVIRPIQKRLGLRNYDVSSSMMIHHPLGIGCRHRISLWKACNHNFISIWGTHHLSLFLHFLRTQIQWKRLSAMIRAHRICNFACGACELKKMTLFSTSFSTSTKRFDNR